MRAIEPRTVIVWGDAAALKILRTKMEVRGWTWTTGILGGQTPALFLEPPDGVQAPEVLQLISEINSGRFGKLDAGYGVIGKPAGQDPKPEDA
jgi:hypothetical protein